jgi:hypothetical protein
MKPQRREGRRGIWTSPPSALLAPVAADVSRRKAKDIATGRFSALFASRRLSKSCPAAAGGAWRASAASLRRRLQGGTRLSPALRQPFQLPLATHTIMQHEN